jgi:4-amino-4-deoxy-L-arabinose transferase-like glycosyltransferase
MSSNAVSHTAQIPAAATPPGVLADALRAMAALFRITTPLAQDRITHLWWLAALIVGGTVVRFWGLGAVGLHGDEETMAMAARHILIDGRPILPSGMFYPRGLTQLYLMAFSASVFGESEWAWRLPSVLCGIGLIPLSYVASRRYLRPHWSIAYAAAVAFLPALIIDSQTARMYVFLVTLITAMLVCLHAWERTNRDGWLIAAVLCLIVGLDMHALAVAAALTFLVPGLARGDGRKLMLGACAAAAVCAAFVIIHSWVDAQYPTPSVEFAAEFGPSRPQGSMVPRDFQLAFDLGLRAAGVVIGFFAVRASRVAGARTTAAATALLLLLAGIVLQLALYYHIAALAYAAGVVVLIRYGDSRARRRVAVLLILAALLFVVHATLLASASGTFIRLIGALVGHPSMWPYLRIAQLSPSAGLLTAGLIAWGLYQLARRRELPDYWLLAMLSVWAPVFALGAFAWNVPPRYTEVSLPPMLLCAFALCQHITDYFLSRRPEISRARLSIVAAAASALCMINPVAVAGVVNAGYRIHPDHKGASEFVRSLGIVAEDIVLAEDVLQQTYYLGAVDYWLIGPDVARRFVKRAGERAVDFYTGTPVIATPAMLDELMQENADKRIFVIGSGEDQKSHRRSVRGGELHAAIESDRFVVIHTGRDGLTRVLQAAPRAAVPSAATKAESKADAAALIEKAESGDSNKTKSRAERAPE